MDSVLLDKQVLLLFQLLYTSLGIDIVDGHGSDKEIRRQVQSKKTKVMLYLSHSYNSKGRFSASTLLKRWNTSALKVGVPYRW